jgi:hypothetical protein
MSLFTKDPSDNLDYGFDWSGWLGPGETIASSTWDVPDGITAGVASYDNTTTTQWLSAGTSGIEYTCTNNIVTNLGRTGDRSFTILVSQLAVPGPTGASATDLITRALRLLGVVSVIDTPEAEYLAAGKVALDDFVDSLGLERAAIFTIGRHVYPLSTGVASYTIGLGGDFNQVRPVWIDRASVRPNRSASPVMEMSIGRPMTIAQWQGLQVKGASGSHPFQIYYDQAHSAGLGTIYLDPVPDNNLSDLVLYTPEAPSTFVDLTTVYALPQGWARMLRYNLAVELADDFPAIPLSPRVERKAKESLAAVKRANWRPVDASLDPMMPGLRGGGRFDLYSGS